MSKHGGVEFELSSAPADMTISSTGKISWTVPDDFKDTKVNVIVSIKDSTGQSQYETFSLVAK